MYNNRFISFLLVIVIFMSSIFLSIDLAYANQSISQIKLQSQPFDTVSPTTGSGIITTGGGISTTGSALKNISVDKYKYFTNYFYDMDKQELFYYDSITGEKQVLNFVDSYTDEGDLYLCPIDYDKDSIEYQKNAQELTIEFLPEKDKGYCLYEFDKNKFTINFITISKKQDALDITAISDFYGIYGAVVLSTESNAKEFNNNYLPKNIIPNFLIYDLEYTLPGNWYIEDDVLETPGNKYAHYKLHTPDLYSTNVLNIEEIVYPIKVIDGSTIDEDFIDLSYYSCKDRMGNPIFQWVWIIPDFKEVKLFESLDQGLTWNEINSDYDPSCMAIYFDGKYSVSKNCLTLYKNLLKKELTYQIKLKYNDKFSNTLTFTFPHNGNTNDFDYSVGGDRDGSDQNNPIIEPIYQLAPSIPDTDNKDNSSNYNNNDTDNNNNNNNVVDYDSNLNNNNSSEDSIYPKTEDIVNSNYSTSYIITTSSQLQTNNASSNNTIDRSNYEYVNNIITSISGNRLKYILDADNKLVVEKNGISIEITRETIETLDIADEDIFTVSIEKYNTYGFSIYLLKNNVGITSFNEIKVMFPINKSMIDKIKNVYNVNTLQTMPITFNYDLNLGIVAINSVGTYDIFLEQEEDQNIILNTSDTFNDNTPTINKSNLPIPSQSMTMNNNLLTIVLSIGISIAFISFGVIYYLLRKKSHE